MKTSLRQGHGGRGEEARGGLLPSYKNRSMALLDLWNSLFFGVIAVGLCIYQMRVKFRLLLQRRRNRELSETDLLTGVNNRNAMNNRVLQFVGGEVNYRTISVVFADLNGLKPINDNEGHNAGDALLRSAAEILKETFRDCEIYRAGGDEFVVVAIDIPKDSLDARVQKLRDKSKIKGNVSFAIGFFYDEKAGDIRRAMREADALMYEDKKANYAHSRG